MLAVETEISQLLNADTVRVGLPGSTKDEVLKALLELVSNDPAVADPDTVQSDVMDREALMSTGVGQGLALPHAKTRGVTDTVAAFAVSRQPIDFGSIDDQPVQLFFLLLAPESARSQHIKVLSRISRLMNRIDVREELLAAKRPEEVLEILGRGEEALLHG
ncbi:MAG: PTS sugar transporter subunit IIA [Rhodothermia bacterium]|nr:PTS sugar transporter subunit IIA [Rhodothermia bacterium]